MFLYCLPSLSVPCFTLATGGATATALASSFAFLAPLDDALPVGRRVLLMAVLEVEGASGRRLAVTATRCTKGSAMRKDGERLSR